VGHAECPKRREMHATWLESLKERYQSEDLGTDVTVILKMILEHSVWGCGLNLRGSGYELVADSCEHNNGTWVSINIREVLS
jgi:hypothetical protein